MELRIETRSSARWRSAAVMMSLLWICSAAGFSEAHPPADEVARRQRLGIRIERRLDAAAAAMAHDDDIADLQRLDREFESGRRRVIMAIRLVGRHHVGDVADDEKLAGTAVEDGLRRRTAVATGNDQGLRLLPCFGKAL